MSSDYLRVIPTEPSWVPDEAHASAALAVVRAAVPAGWDYSVRTHDEVVFVDQGGNFESVSCPYCSSALDDWWQERMGEAAETSFSQLTVTTPCCGREVSLNDLDYRMPAGFARFEIEVEGPERDLLEPSEEKAVAEALRA
ncbi:hypothetical protein ACWD4J_35125 [Streptomyces sp. NPDC002577]